MAFLILRFLAKLGAFLATLNMIGAVLDFFGLPQWFMFAILALMLGGMLLNFGELLSMFKVIDNRQTTIKRPINQNQIRIWHWLMVSVLAGLGIVQFYLWYGLKMPPSSPILLSNSLILMVLALVYFNHQIYQRFFR